MKKTILFVSFLVCGYSLLAQDSTRHPSSRQERRTEKRQHVNSMVRQEEEGILNYTKQTSVGAELRTNGYGAFLEFGRMKSPRFSTIYGVEFTEIKNSKEEKVGTGNFFSNTFIYGKVNNFYQLKLSYGQQYVFGQKGNKNGVAVIGLYEGGLSVGLLKPYYLQVDYNGNTAKYISYMQDSTRFLDESAIIGGAGFGKGWSEVKFKPGLFAKAALRFDFGPYNETVKALEIGVSVDAYAQKIQIMALNPSRQFFYQGHIAFVFGSRK